MGRNERREAARLFGTAMSRISGRRVFDTSVSSDDARELAALAQALQTPIDDGLHLVGVVQSLSSALSAALQRRAHSS